MATSNRDIVILDAPEKAGPATRPGFIAQKFVCSSACAAGMRRNHRLDDAVKSVFALIARP
ncbi:uncharacterized protein (DUF2267 family) [Rhizobium azooxidifex]|jgi:hypothetical protein|uniref:Uncharacterized protein (DUF2267 family) n=1 Tax=Mycoplana azooxidifex TaxID=1636188 RepID=A0A7W6D4W1_9HYPH|nr:hypothetical protein [Mycoplana azooxidifex]MBB3976117.1 uncharacterized protein (DUF2267 family) [Mycoplana azooxidifex]